MILADMVNGSFEILGGFFILNHCRIIFNDKQVKGVSILSTCFFLSWGIWNLYYYPSLNQWWSFIGGCFLVMTNVLYVILLTYYQRWPGGKCGSSR